MNAQQCRYLWLRFRVSLPRRAAGYAAIVLVLGLVGGTALASIAAARRTDSSFPTYLASTNHSDLIASLYEITNATDNPSSFSPALTKRVAAIQGVTRVEAAIGLNAYRISETGTPLLEGSGSLANLGSITGLYFDMDRPGVIAGRMADPQQPDEIVVSPAAAAILGVAVGDRIRLGLFANSVVAAPGFGTVAAQPAVALNARVVGIVELSSDVVVDDVDRTPAPVLFTPALTHAVLSKTHSRAQQTQYGVQIQSGARGVPTVEQSIVDLLSRTNGYGFQATDATSAKVQAALRPESLALGVFGGISGLAVILTALLMLSRQIRSNESNLQVLRAVGASPRMTVLDDVLGLAAAIIAGAGLAVGLAAAISPLAPLGPVRRVYPHLGVAADWAVLGMGAAVIVGTLLLATVFFSFRSSPHRLARDHVRQASRPSLAARGAAAGLPPAVMIGVRFALDSDRSRTAVPVRTALIGAMLAVLTSATTLTFGSGLHTLLSHPSLYGWNWDYDLAASNTVPPQSTSLLDSDPLVSAWTGYHQASLLIDGRVIPVLQSQAHPVVAPPVLTGRLIQTRLEIGLGPATLAQFGKQIGDTVTVSYGRPQDAPIYLPPTKAKIVATMTLPAISKPLNAQDHVTMGSGAFMRTALFPKSFRRVFHSSNPTLNGPELTFVRMRPGVSAAAGFADMQRIAAAGNQAFAAMPGNGGAGNEVSAHGVQRPAQIVNYRSTGQTPVLLAGGLAVGCLLALGFTIGASVRRRRGDLAVLKALGFTRRQLRTIVASQATVAAAVGIVVGIPLGVALGRSMWRAFANQIYAVPDPTIPWTQLVIVSLVALLAANLVALRPARQAASIPAAEALRAQ